MFIKYIHVHEWILIFQTLNLLRVVFLPLVYSFHFEIFNLYLIFQAWKVRINFNKFLLPQLDASISAFQLTVALFSLSFQSKILVLSSEEQRLLEIEGVSLPTDLPLTKVKPSQSLPFLMPLKLLISYVEVIQLFLLYCKLCS